MKTTKTFDLKQAGVPVQRAVCTQIKETRKS